MTGERQKEGRAVNVVGKWIAIGSSIGIGVGASLGNIAIGLVVGIVLGAAIGRIEKATKRQIASEK